MLALTEQGVSKQLRKLAAAGLVEARRTGYYVVYALHRDELARLGDDVGSYLRHQLVPIERPPRDTGPAATRVAGRRERHL